MRLRLRTQKPPVLMFLSDIFHLNFFPIPKRHAFPGMHIHCENANHLDKANPGLTV